MDNIPDPLSPIHSVELEHAKYSITKILADHGCHGLAQSLSVESRYHPEYQAHMVTAMATALRKVEHTGRRIEIHIDIHEEWPEDWWQAVKQRWLPQWILKRWPVRTRKIDVAHHIDTPTQIIKVCPHVHAPDHGKHIRFFTQ